MNIQIRKPPQAVIFDFFGTLVSNLTLSETKDVLRQMASVLSAPPNNFVQRWLDTFTQRATGVFPTVRWNIEVICGELNIAPGAAEYEEAIRLRYEFTKRNVSPRSSVIPVLKKLRASGLKTGLITDCSCELPEIWSSTVFANLFDAAVFSNVAKMRKPHPEIYRKAASQLGVECSECLYVGDGSSNELSGASSVGMHPVQLFVAEEQNSPDTHKIDQDAWKGMQISDLAEIIPLIALGRPFPN